MLSVVLTSLNNSATFYILHHETFIWATSNTVMIQYILLMKCQFRTPGSILPAIVQPQKKYQPSSRGENCHEFYLFRGGRRADTFTEFGSGLECMKNFRSVLWIIKEDEGYTVSFLELNFYTLTFSGQCNSHLHTRHVAPSRPCMLRVRHKIQHSLTDRLG